MKERMGCGTCSTALGTMRGVLVSSQLVSIAQTGQSAAIYPDECRMANAFRTNWSRRVFLNHRCVFDGVSAVQWSHKGRVAVVSDFSAHE